MNTSGFDQQAVPDKRIFVLTPAGECALDTWLASGTDVGWRRTKDEFLLRIFLGHRMERPTLERLLGELRQDTEQRIADLSAIADQLRGTPSKEFGRLTARFGVHQEQSRLRWLDEVAAALDDIAAAPVPAGESARQSSST